MRLNSSEISFFSKFLCVNHLISIVATSAVLTQNKKCIVLKAKLHVVSKDQVSAFVYCLHTGISIKNKTNITLDTP